MPGWSAYPSINQLHKSTILLFISIKKNLLSYLNTK